MIPVIIIKNIDGSCGICTAPPDSKFTLQEIAARDFAGKDWYISTREKDVIKGDLRSAWTYNVATDNVDMDIAKAKIIRADTIREDRDKNWEDFDKRYVIAQRDKQDMTALEAERLALKDAPYEADRILSGATTAEEIRAITIEQAWA